MPNETSQILLRTERDFHKRLLRQAKQNGQSLNEFCLERLSIPSSLEGTPYKKFRDVLAHAEIFLKQKLLGLVFYGSQARGEARSDSDWDFLLVVDTSIELSRGVYRKWDELTPTFVNEGIEVNFVHKPPQTRVASGFWSEIALDGIVLFERDFVVSQFLSHIRKEIADGIIIRRVSHGQSYWVHRGVA